MADRIPVVVLTGHLGAGKTTVLNHLLRTPGARVGVIVNDFGAVNVDAGLVSGQVDEPVSIAGGCLCCVADDSTLDDALATLARPRLALDVIVVEASGIAEPSALAAMVRHSSARGVRPGGVIDVVDAHEHFATVDTGPVPPSRYAAATLVVLNKCDRVADANVLARVESRVRQVNPHVHIVPVHHGRLDPALVFDAANATDDPDQLPFAAAVRDEHDHVHTHARSVTVQSNGPVDAGRLLDLLDDPPRDAYRLKGSVTVAGPPRNRDVVVQIVGRTVDVASATGRGPSGFLVAIGADLDEDATRERLERVLAPAERSDPADARRLQRLLRTTARATRPARR